MKPHKLSLAKPDVGREEVNAANRVLKSGFLTEGCETLALEKEFAEYIGVKHAVAATSCSTALEVALRALEVGPGDEIVCPDFTYPISASLAFNVGAKPVLVDVSLEDYNIDFNEVEKAITKKTKAIVPVSLFGNPLDPKPLRELQESHDGRFAIVEDAACSIGSGIGGKKTGSFADFAAFSLHPRKVITCGEGGLLTTNNDELAVKARMLKRFGLSFPFEGRSSFELPGNNFKLSDILAAVARVQLRKINEILAKRREQARVYDDLLSNYSHLVSTPAKKNGLEYNYQSYCIYTNLPGIRDKLIEELKKFGVETQIGTFCLHLQPLFQKFQTRKVGDCANSVSAYENVLSLPMASNLEEEDQKFVVEKLVETLNTLAK